MDESKLIAGLEALAKRMDMKQWLQGEPSLAAARIRALIAEAREEGKLNFRCICEHEGEMVYLDLECPVHGSPPSSAGTEGEGLDPETWLECNRYEIQCPHRVKAPYRLVRRAVVLLTRYRDHLAAPWKERRNERDD